MTFNRWIDDAWNGDKGAHAALMNIGVGVVCAFVPKQGVRVESCQAYVDQDAMKAAQLGVEITKNEAIVRLLFRTTTGVSLAQAPKNGDTLETAGAPTLTIASRITSDDDSWTFLCSM